jgi:hypothetical protein
LNSEFYSPQHRRKEGTKIYWNIKTELSMLISYAFGGADFGLFPQKKSWLMFLIALELAKKIFEKTLADRASTALKRSQMIFHSRSSLYFEPTCISKIMIDI